jgi:hypothetical protein
VCDFHRKQAWDCYIKGAIQHGHGLNEAVQKALKQDLDNLADSENEEAMMVNLDVLQNSAAFASPKIRKWLQDTWLNHLKV